MTDGFSHKALDVIAESLRLHAEALEARLRDTEDEDEGADLSNDLHYLRTLLADVEERVRRLVDSLGTGR